jgi:hypothetical protein
MKWLLLFLAAGLLYACFKPRVNYDNNQPPPAQKVWGSRPVYEDAGVAKRIQYIPTKQSLIHAGNIYAFGNFIFQVDVGRGIHVIDNTQPSLANRIGFITVNGCAQISIKGAYLYTNSFDDLVTLDISAPIHVKELSRVANAFPDYRHNYPLAQPEEAGWYTCPRPDSVVIRWVKDSVYAYCYKK